MGKRTVERDTKAIITKASKKKIRLGTCKVEEHGGRKTVMAREEPVSLSRLRHSNSMIPWRTSNRQWFCLGIKMKSRPSQSTWKEIQWNANNNRPLTSFEGVCVSKDIRNIEVSEEEGGQAGPEGMHVLPSFGGRDVVLHGRVLGKTRSRAQTWNLPGVNKVLNWWVKFS